MYRWLIAAVSFLSVLGMAGTVQAQQSGVITGRVTLKETGEPVHGAVVMVVGLSRSTTTREDGSFRIGDVPPGKYEVLAQREHLTDARASVVVEAGGTATASFALALSPIHEEVTVTASAGGDITTFEAFNAVETVDSIELARSAPLTLGDALEREPGIAKRSFGPGTSRPIIRGFDGDRVLVTQDGIRVGDLSSQSGDHGVGIDPTSLDRIEVVRGPATLLFGSNAVGGVVNAITPHEGFRRSDPEGTRAQFLTDGGSANGQAGVSASFQTHRGGWLLWGGGGGRRTGDYMTPVGPVKNSSTRAASGSMGFGYAGATAFFSAGVQVEDGRYGIPFAGVFETGGFERAPQIDIDLRRRALRVDLGARGLNNPLVQDARVTASYVDWRHEEIEIEDGRESVETALANRLAIVRVELDQRRRGPWSGRLGLLAEARTYRASGAEALAPPTRQTTWAAFAYEELGFGRTRVQFGARAERNAYDAGDRPGAGGEAEEALAPAAPEDRSFTGVSASAGLHLDLGRGAALVASASRSYRAPALEELYTFGPHLGNLAFEIGSPALEREATLGLDVSVRHRSARARSEFNVFTYAIDNFVFPAFTGEIADGLRVAFFVQGDSRFAGFDAKTDVQVTPHLWMNIGAGYVEARLTRLGLDLPRIPPLHGTVGAEILWRSLTVKPEIVWSASQDRVYVNETPTDRYATLDVEASYILSRGHLAHVFSVRASNLTNETYRLHTSFIKDLAPEMGRSVKVSYALRLF